MKVIAAISTVVSCVHLLFSGFPTVTVTERKIINIGILMISFRTIVTTHNAVFQAKNTFRFSKFLPKTIYIIKLNAIFRAFKNNYKFG